jgi:hypothetical protein
MREEAMSEKMKPSDPAYWMLSDDFTTTPVKGLYRDYCYICRDPEFAQMGLPLCYECPECKGHVAADDTICDDCGYDAQTPYWEKQELIYTKETYYFGEKHFGWVHAKKGYYFYSKEDIPDIDLDNIFGD